MHRVFYSLLIAVILFVSVPAYSATVHYNGTHRVTSITGLEVSSVLYNVDFFNDSYNDIWPSGTPEFWADETGAGSAQSAINTVLTGEGGPGILDMMGIEYHIPFQYVDSGPNIDTKRSFRDKVGWIEVIPGIDDYYATFSAVPIPGAVWLLGSGLIGIVGVRRKIKK